MTKEQALSLIERLADKTLSFGCAIEDKNHAPSRIMFVSHGSGDSYSGIQIGAEHTYNFFNGYKNPDMKILGHPVFIGDVLEKMRNIENSNVTKLLFAWEPFDFSKPLSAILEEAEWDVAQDFGYENNESITYLKSPALELFSFLDTLFPIK